MSKPGADPSSGISLGDALKVPTAELRNYIEQGYMFLSNFQDGVGPVSIDGGIKFASAVPTQAEIAQLEKWSAWQKVALAEMDVLRPIPKFQGPKYRGSFQRGDFADFHQRFSLVPRRMRGKCQPPQRNRSSMLCSAYPPGGDPLDFPDTPPLRGVPKIEGGVRIGHLCGVRPIPRRTAMGTPPYFSLHR